MMILTSARRLMMNTILRGNMDTQNTVVEIGYYRWPRDLAIHEAGHAIAAWFLAIRR
jgi:hypothetical protein